MTPSFPPPGGPPAIPHPHPRPAHTGNSISKKSNITPLDRSAAEALLQLHKSTIPQNTKDAQLPVRHITQENWGDTQGNSPQGPVYYPMPQSKLSPLPEVGAPLLTAAHEVKRHRFSSKRVPWTPEENATLKLYMKDRLEDYYLSEISQELLKKHKINRSNMAIRIQMAKIRSPSEQQLKETDTTI